LVKPLFSGKALAGQQLSNTKQQILAWEKVLRGPCSGFHFRGTWLPFLCKYILQCSNTAQRSSCECIQPFTTASFCTSYVLLTVIGYVCISTHNWHNYIALLLLSLSIRFGPFLPFSVFFPTPPWLQGPAVWHMYRSVGSKRLLACVDFFFLCVEGWEP
jgi:hypothetical protein